MSHSVARRVLGDVDPNTPWYDTQQFIRSDPAFTSDFKDELRRCTHQGGVTLQKLLCNTTCHSRVQWYFNHLRRLHLVNRLRMRRCAQKLTVGSGINRRFSIPRLSYGWTLRCWGSSLRTIRLLHVRRCVGRDTRSIFMELWVNGDTIKRTGSPSVAFNTSMERCVP